MSMYNLLYYSKNFRKTTRSFWNYYRDEPNIGYNNDGRDRIFYPIRGSEGFNYETKFVGNLPAGRYRAELEDIKIVVPLKHLSRFILTLGILLINAEIELILKWSQNGAFTEKAYRGRIHASDDPATEPVFDLIDSPSDLKFNITDCKLYVPVVTLQAEYENKSDEELKTRLTINFTWNKHRSQVINQTATNNLNYLIDPTFNNVNRLFCFGF